MNLEERLAEIGRTLQQDLSREFPDWSITREGSCDWKAELLGHAPIRAASAAELRDQLREYVRRRPTSR